MDSNRVDLAVDNYRYLFLIGTRHTGREEDILFPEWTDAEADAKLDEALASFFPDPPSQVGCWSRIPSKPADLELRLLARGFTLGWRPHWMGKALAAGSLLPGDVSILADNVSDLRDLRDLPYSKADAVMTYAENPIPGVLMQRFVARMEGAVVGQTMVLCTPGVAGIYNVGVLPSFRRKGIGKAMMEVACAYAFERGWSYVVLNATVMGQPLYRKCGFIDLEEGMTWWLNTAGYPPAPELVRLALAIGRGGPFHPVSLVDVLPCGMTPMELAVHCHQIDSVHWLRSCGVALRALDAWDLGWKDEARRLAVESPNERYTRQGLSLLHFSVIRDDEDLARMALAAGTDVNMPDLEYDGHALGWAWHFGRENLKRLFTENSSGKDA
jgi:ribosomal protein S18 acetylase RimI-like enzyme